ncbi:hypothetical protein [Nocardia testacea]|uniref:hypothetical protein n=1 Tax=Nocardia testacea TaxID=248551 RepID=UPI0002E87546|nr:hypothetical protein [Nocardia testacea]
MQGHHTTLETAFAALDGTVPISNQFGDRHWTLTSYDASYRVSVFLPDEFVGLPGVQATDNRRVVWLSGLGDTPLKAANTALAELGRVLSAQPAGAAA